MRGFLAHGGQKGPQRKVLREGVYAINTAQFVVLTRANTYALALASADSDTIEAMRAQIEARDGFHAAMQAADAVYMVGDYTDVDPAITAYLQRHNAVGVPLYVVYPRGGGEGEILPVLLTPGVAEDALARAAR